jgi:signal transduction histidine kinase/HAMP domain-containing protein
MSAASSSRVEPRSTRLLGMRWWLALAFAAVAGLTAIAVVAVLGNRSEAAFRTYAEEFAVGNTFAASEALRRIQPPADLATETEGIAARRHLALFVFDRAGRPLTPLRSQGAVWKNVPNGAEALHTALAGRRYTAGAGDGSAFVVALQLHGDAGGAVVGYSHRPDLSTQLGIVRHEFVQSALLAFAVGAALGLLIASLIARRLARIARAAKAIGEGDFTVHTYDRFPDEVGSLAWSIERMGAQLEEVFDTLERDRDRLEKLLDRLNEGVLLVDSELKIEYANGEARKLLGVDGRLDEAALRRVGLDGVHRLARDLFATGLPGHMTIEDEGRTLLVAGIPPSASGENAIIVVEDESERARNERVQREFATSAAHELRTPLASIVTAVEMLQTGAKHEPQMRDEFLDVIERESGRLTRLTRALLVLARAGARDELPHLGTVRIAPLLEQVAASLPRRNGVEIEVDCPRTLSIVGDSDLLEQALSNVATNAVQHTARGRVAIRGRAVRNTVVIDVSDTGRGIAPPDHVRIFDRFYRAGDDGDDGFGLGLSIAREAVRTLGGEIELESEPELGTTVRITLKRAPTPPQTAAAPNEPIDDPAPTMAEKDGAVR